MIALFIKNEGVITSVLLTPSLFGTTPGMEEVGRSLEPESRGLG